jgi:hypothetical protein
VKLLYDTSLQHVREYLARMNVAPEFLSFMQSFEPDNIRLLKKSELQRFGLGENDPVFQEREVANRAASMGISSLELRKRFAQLDRCKGIQGGDSEQTERMFDECRGTILYGISTKTFKERNAVLERHCSFARCLEQDAKMVGPGDSYNRCQESFMATGQEIPCK